MIRTSLISLALVGQPFVLGECLIKIRNTRGIMALIKDRAKWSPLAKSGCLPIKSTLSAAHTLQTEFSPTVTRDSRTPYSPITFSPRDHKMLLIF
jgi:hypothetical protein